MCEEIKTKCAGMKDPRAITFWELDQMNPSSEDLTLTVYEVVVLVLDVDLQCACMIDMNVYVLGAESSGFTLDDVEKIPLSTVKPAHMELAQKTNKCHAALAEEEAAAATPEEGGYTQAHTDAALKIQNAQRIKTAKERVAAKREELAAAESEAAAAAAEEEAAAAEEEAPAVEGGEYEAGHEAAALKIQSAQRAKVAKAKVAIL